MEAVSQQQMRREPAVSLTGSMTVITLTIEKTDGLADDASLDEHGPDWGVVIIKIGSYEVARAELTYNEREDGRDGLERAAARVLAERLGK
jgi:hypothetical protein